MVIVVWNEDWQWKPKYSKKTCTRATFSATNPASLNPGSNPGRRGGKPPTILFYYLVCEAIGTAATPGLLCQPRVIVKQMECRLAGETNRSSRRKPAPAPLCPPQIPHDYTRVRTRAAAVGSHRLTAWALARPSPNPKYYCCANLLTPTY
jgi:hypothetical protein